MNIKISDSIWWNALQTHVPLFTYNGNTNLTRTYLQHVFKPTQNLNITAGLHTMHFALNNSNALEPRIAGQLQISKKLSVSAGVGVHHQLQPFTTYFFNRTGLNNLKDSLTNINLGFIKSNHFIVGADYLPAPNYRIKVEAYYQQIDGAGVEAKPSSYSTLNEGAFYYMIPKAFCTNKGKGFNRGIEWTIEKFFSNHFYFLHTGSIYESKYLASDARWRGTAFNGKWNAVFLGGYEWKVKTNHLLSVNLKMAMLGGRPHSPVDLVASKQWGDTRLDENLNSAYSLRYKTYLKPDVKISYRLNRKKVSHEFGFSIDNFINYPNVQSIEYDKVKDYAGYSYQNGFFPVIQYKIEF